MTAPAVELRRYPPLVQRGIPHAAADPAHPLGIIDLLAVQIKSVATPKKHQKFFSYPTYGLTAACGALPAVSTKYEIVARVGQRAQGWGTRGKGQATFGQACHSEFRRAFIFSTD